MQNILNICPRITVTDDVDFYYRVFQLIGIFTNKPLTHTENVIMSWYYSKLKNGSIYDSGQFRADLCLFLGIKKQTFYRHILNISDKGWLKDNRLNPAIAQFINWADSTDQMTIRVLYERGNNIKNSSED